jgi:uncharacterized protein (TIGR03790 family)
MAALLNRKSYFCMAKRFMSSASLCSGLIDRAALCRPVANAGLVVVLLIAVLIGARVHAQGIPESGHAQTAAASSTSGVASHSSEHAMPASAADSSAGVGARTRPVSMPSSAPVRQVIARAPRVIGRVMPTELGVVINTADPYSVEVGEYYVQQRKIPAAHVLRLELPVHSRLSTTEFDALKRHIDTYFGPKVQALALTWVQPYAVSCMSITGALALGVDEALCRSTCSKTGLSPYFNSASGQPFRDHGFRPSMLIAAGSVTAARQLIDRGVAADASLGLRGAMPVDAYFMATSDPARNVRARNFPPPGVVPRSGVTVRLANGELPHGQNRLLMVQTGLAVLNGLDTLGWVPGALADHLTSFGGQLDQTSGQTTALAWIDSGVTASYGTVSEPCNHPQKFPDPQLVLLHYMQGSTLLEAYWKSVRWPQQGVFVGEPLAAPFARR